MSPPKEAEIMELDKIQDFLLAASKSVSTPWAVGLQASKQAS